MQLRSTQALALGHLVVRVRNRDLEDSLCQINCTSRGVVDVRTLTRRIFLTSRVFVRICVDARECCLARR
jgi:hypothetical protein